MPATPSSLSTVDGQRDFRLLLVSTVPILGSYALLLPVVPLWATTGGAGPAGAGATNAVLLGVTVGTQLLAPYVLRRLGHRETYVVGAVLLGLPVFGYGLTASLPVVVAVSAVRGIGFALVVVTGSAFVPRLLPASRRGRGLGLLGAAIGAPAVLIQPTGPWLSAHIGFRWLFVIGGVLPLVGAAVAATMRLRTRDPSARDGSAHSSRTGVGTLRAFAVPVVVMVAGSIGGSVYVTFLPTAIDRTAAVTLGLLAYNVGGLAGRWYAGVVGDRRRGPALAVPGVAGGAVGLAVTAAGTVTPWPWFVVGAMSVGGLCFGLGLGAIQNATLTAMFGLADRHGYDVASTAWNIAVDAGSAIGSIAIGVAADAAGFPVTFAATAVIVASTLPLAVRVVRPGRPGRVCSGP